jgi:hypothetical protein
MIFLGIVCALIGVAGGSALTAAVGACLAFSHSVLLYDWGKRDLSTPRQASPAGRATGIAMIVAGAAVIVAALVIVLAQ